MYKEYVDLLNERDEESSSRTSVDQNGLILKPKKSSGWEMLMDYVDEQQAIPAVKSEVEDYLSEPTYRPNDNGHMSFCALEWWKLNSGKYRVLSQMAADVLAIPISTVASESTFSAGGRVIDPFRASLDSSTVQTLICGGDWLRVMHGIKKKPKVKQITPIEVSLYGFGLKLCLADLVLLATPPSWWWLSVSSDHALTLLVVGVLVRRQSLGFALVVLCVLVVFVSPVPEC
ncbi:hypothetical protein P8452_61133 [Trifolium repens]|nr:hypothetical protein P8452_61133 [Trifolium repens]